LETNEATAQTWVIADCASSMNASLCSRQYSTIGWNTNPNPTFINPNDPRDAVQNPNDPADVTVIGGLTDEKNTVEYNLSRSDANVKR
jgi:hypothetical protein